MERTTLQIMFLEKDGQFSIRKTLAVMCGLLFFIACIVALCKGPELPVAYIGIISAVFLFYFAKNRMSGNGSTDSKNIEQKVDQNDTKTQ